MFWLCCFNLQPLTHCPHFSSLLYLIILHPPSLPSIPTPLFLSTILSLQLSPMWLSHTIQIKTILMSAGSVYEDWNQYPDLSLVGSYGHKKPAHYLWQQAGLSLVLTFEREYLGLLWSLMEQRRVWLSLQRLWRVQTGLQSQFGWGPFNVGTQVIGERPAKSAHSWCGQKSKSSLFYTEDGIWDMGPNFQILNILLDVLLHQ